MAWLALSLGAAPAREKPAIVLARGERVLVLPEGMQAALARHDPRFVPWREHEFDAAIRKDYKYGERQTPFAVIGDFNGDGRPDVALVGQSRGHGRLECVLSGRQGFRAVDVDSFSLTTLPSGGGLYIFLTLVPRGKLQLFDGPMVRLKSDAVQENVGPRASSIFSYRRGRFVELVAGEEGEEK